MTATNPNPNLNPPAMRILLVRPESTGGIGVHVDSLTRALREAGHDVRTLVATGTGAIPAIRHAARQAHVDVVHAHGLRAGAAACLATRKRTVVTLHNAPANRAGEMLMRLIAQRADAVLAASHDLVEAVTGNGAKNAHFGPVVAPALPGADASESAGPHRAPERARPAAASSESVTAAWSWRSAASPRKRTTPPFSRR